jgi:uncharacterized membrane protein
MTPQSKFAAFLAYLLPVIGWLYVFVAHRQDRLALHHTKQSIMLVIMAIIAPLIWAIVGWVLTFIPYVGALLAASTFSLVVSVYLLLIVLWIVGMVYALRAKSDSIPLIGAWAERLPLG